MTQNGHNTLRNVFDHQFLIGLAVVQYKRFQSTNLIIRAIKMVDEDEVTDSRLLGLQKIL
jgi:hypothetical protein